MLKTHRASHRRTSSRAVSPRPRVVTLVLFLVTFVGCVLFRCLKGLWVLVAMVSATVGVRTGQSVPEPPVWGHDSQPLPKTEPQPFILSINSPDSSQPLGGSIEVPPQHFLRGTVCCECFRTYGSVFPCVRWCV